MPTALWLGVLFSLLGEPREPLRVGTKEAAPFVVRGPDGTLEGPSLRLWDELADDLEVDYELEERDLSGLLDGLRDGSLDVAVAAITVTAEREQTIDFSHPFHSAGLAIVTPRRDHGLWMALFDTLLSRALLQLVAVLAIVQFAVGTLVWLLERRRNPEQFAERPVSGLFSGFWWSTVTMTTVGYGDKTPVTGAGRAVALMWMLCSVVIISTFTATVASRLTMAEIESAIASPRDLERVRVGVVSNSTSDVYAQERGLDFERYDDLRAVLDAVESGAVDAAVHDAPILTEVLANDSRSALVLLPARFRRQDYAIALPQGSSLREPINRMLPNSTYFEEFGPSHE